MKTILHITIILLAAAIVAGGLFLIVNNTSIASGASREGGQPPAMSGTEGAHPERPEGMPMGGGPGGDHEGGASIGMVLLQALVTLAKLAGITAIVLVVEKGISLISKKHIADPA